MGDSSWVLMADQSVLVQEITISANLTAFFIGLIQPAVNVFGVLETVPVWRQIKPVLANDTVV
jgi:hypothetical protein